MADGTILSNLELNGTNFISETEIKPEVFTGKLSHVTFEGPEDEMAEISIGEHGRMELIRCQFDNALDKYAFVLIDVPEEQIKFEQLRGDIEYLAMMSDIEL